MVDFAYDICTLGESLIDTLFITKDREDSIQMYGNPGGAPVKEMCIRDSAMTFVMWTLIPKQLAAISLSRIAESARPSFVTLILSTKK